MCSLRNPFSGVKLPPSNLSRSRPEREVLRQLGPRIPDRSDQFPQKRILKKLPRLRREAQVQ